MKSFDAWLNTTTPPVRRPALTPEAQLERDDFIAVFDKGDSCTCWNGCAPCGWCTHPGNPMNQDVPECWVDGVIGEKDGDRLPDIPLYKP
jgi:hypothetical protein